MELVQLDLKTTTAWEILTDPNVYYIGKITDHDRHKIDYKHYRRNESIIHDNRSTSMCSLANAINEPTFITDLETGNAVVVRIILDENKADVFECDDILFETFKDADSVLNELKSLIDEYGCLTVADFLDLIGCPVYNHMVNRFGWTDIHDAKVVQVGDKYALQLPKITVIEQPWNQPWRCDNK